MQLPPQCTPTPLTHTQETDRQCDTAQPISTPVSTVFISMSVSLASLAVWIAALLTIQPLIVWQGGLPLSIPHTYLPNHLPTKLKG